ncbi:hypothetical protein GC105_00140 [Alkalibaculum sp. M08DMB]|uniref:Uncharacterized protein n=1 Tax=Alkalibaculum sporogenes TaxID=2655001 RepID=A0A6A7K4M0_9FIRM|nr:hypothetical protein [Alkalibaculum sporogenes]MPW24207.1 hypothetical protein [Alkalibaculum sporogenes]
MKSRKILVLSVIMVVILVIISGCVPGDGNNSQINTAGFFSGVWHGWIAPFSLIYSIFNKNIGIYEVYNNGFWYDFGFYMAIISGFGSLALSRKKKKGCKEDR